MKLEEDGYNFEWAYTENCTTDNIESVIRSYCDAGYNVILGWAGISRDAIAAVHSEYPDIAFMVSGSDVVLEEPNMCAMDANPCDAGFILGAIAALKSESGVIGSVGAKPTGNENALMNCYAQGAKYVNPNIKVKTTWINSYYDPVKTKEVCNALIAQGVDVILGDRDGYLDACQEAGIYALGNKVNSIEKGPDFILGCSVTIPYAQGMENDPTTDAQGMHSKYAIDATLDLAIKDDYKRVHYPAVDLEQFLGPLRGGPAPQGTK